MLNQNSKKGRSSIKESRLNLSDQQAIKLFKSLANSSNLKELSKIYDDAYLFFSKYDHFGILYFEVYRMKYEEKLQRIFRGIELFLGGQSILHIMLNQYTPNDTFVIEQSNLAATYLFEKVVSPNLQDNSA